MVASLLLASLHVGALNNAWYWLYWWFDIPTHFLGGIVTALIALVVYSKYSSIEPQITRKNIFLVSLLSVVVIGVLWEGFELIIGGREFADSDYLVDTVADMFADTSGGLVVYLIMSVLFHKEFIKNVGKS